jgi:hypothetical protein
VLDIGAIRLDQPGYLTVRLRREDGMLPRDSSTSEDRGFA